MGEVSKPHYNLLRYYKRNKEIVRYLYNVSLLREVGGSKTYTEILKLT